MKMTDLRVVKTLECIKNGFVVCIKEKTFSSITVQDITVAAKINRSTFYKYYEDKYQLREVLVNETMQELVQSIEQHYLAEKKQIILSADILKQQLTFMWSRKDWYMFLWNRHMELYVYEDMQQVFEKSLQKSFKMLPQESIESISILQKHELFCKIFAASVMANIKWWYKAMPLVSVDAMVTIIMKSVAEGMYSAFSLNTHMVLKGKTSSELK